MNSFSRLLERTPSGRLLDLTVSNPTKALTDYPHAEIARAFCAATDYAYQPDPLGTLAAREHVAGWYAERGISVSPSQLALTASTSEAYGLLFKLLLNAGEEVLVPSPSYPLFEYLAQLEGVVARPYQLLYDGRWHVDLSTVESGIAGGVRAMVVVNPNNPTGSFLTAREFDKLEKLCRDNSVALIADEVFMDYAFGDSAERMATYIGRDDALSFSLNGLSKSAGMPQMKLSWIAVNGPAEERAQALQRLELLLDTYLSVGTPVQNALGELLKIGSGIQQQIVKRIQANQRKLEAIIDGSGVHALHCEGGWSRILRVPSVWSEEEWTTRLLIEKSVIVQPGYFFDIPIATCLVVSLLTEPDVFAEGLERLTALATLIRC